MSTATAEKPVAEPLPEDVQTESYTCPDCKGGIAPECVHGEAETDPDSGKVLRRMGIWCEHCNVVFRIKLKIDKGDGKLVPIGFWRRVTSPQGRSEFLSKVDAARGNRQLKPQPQRRS